MKTKDCPIAVVGMNVLVPGSQNIDGFWRDICSGKVHFKDVPEDRWKIDDYYDSNPKAIDKTYSRKGAFLDDIDFHPMEYGIPPNLMESTDSSQLLSLIVAKRLLWDTFEKPNSEINREKISVILGVDGTTQLMTHVFSRLDRPIWMEGLIENGVSKEHAEKICESIASKYASWSEATFPGFLPNVISGRIANKMDLGGSNFITGAACASSLAAVNMSINELKLDHADTVITGGVDNLMHIGMYMSFSKTPAFSPTQQCRPFSKSGDGMVIGEGVTFFALRKLEQAMDEGNNIHAVIKGIGSSSDGKSSSIYAPHPKGQELAISRSLEDAGYDHSTVELIEAHGTATKAGDKAEIEGLSAVFKLKESDFGTQRCAIGSLKSQYGHTKNNAGAMGLAKAILALKHKTLPPTCGVDEPRDSINSKELSSFYVNNVPRPWIANNHPRRAGVSSFGFGGTNFHISVEEHTGENKAYIESPLLNHVLLISADNKDDLIKKINELKIHDDTSFLRECRLSHDSFDDSKQHKIAISIRRYKQFKKFVSHILENTISPSNYWKNIDGICEYFYKNNNDNENIEVKWNNKSDAKLREGISFYTAFEQCRDSHSKFSEENKENYNFLKNILYPIPAFSPEEIETQIDKLKSFQEITNDSLKRMMGELFNDLNVSVNYINDESKITRISAKINDEKIEINTSEDLYKLLSVMRINSIKVDLNALYKNTRPTDKYAPEPKSKFKIPINGALFNLKKK